VSRSVKGFNPIRTNEEDERLRSHEFKLVSQNQQTFEDARQTTTLDLGDSKPLSPSLDNHVLFKNIISTKQHRRNSSSKPSKLCTHANEDLK